MSERFNLRVDAEHAAAIRTLSKRHRTPEALVLRAAVERGLQLLWAGSVASDQARTG